MRPRSGHKRRRSDARGAPTWSWILRRSQSERADGIPDPDKIDVDNQCVFQHPLFSEREILRFSRVPQFDQGEDRLALAVQAVPVIQLLNRERRAQFEETAFSNEAGEAARRISALLKPKMTNTAREIVKPLVKHK